MFNHEQEHALGRTWIIESLHHPSTLISRTMDNTGLKRSCTCLYVGQSKGVCETDMDTCSRQVSTHWVNSSKHLGSPCHWKPFTYCLSVIVHLLGADLYLDNSIIWNQALPETRSSLEIFSPFFFSPSLLLWLDLICLFSSGKPTEQLSHVRVHSFTKLRRWNESRKTFEWEKKCSFASHQWYEQQMHWGQFCNNV